MADSPCYARSQSDQTMKTIGLAPENPGNFVGDPNTKEDWELLGLALHCGTMSGWCPIIVLHDKETAK